MIHTPGDVFQKWLSGRSNHARVAVAIDGDRLLADAGVLGKETIADRLGRSWRLVVFRGDDLAFRLAFRKARLEKNVLIVLARSTDAQSKIDVSYVTDILAANEGGPIAGPVRSGSIPGNLSKDQLSRCRDSAI